MKATMFGSLPKDRSRYFELVMIIENSGKDGSIMFNPCPSIRMLSSVCVRTLRRSANWPGGPGERKRAIHNEQVQQKANNTTVHVVIHVARWLSPGQNYKKILESKAKWKENISATRVPSISNSVSVVRTQRRVHNGCNSCCDLQRHLQAQQLGAGAGGVHMLSCGGQLQVPV
ncbi:hypothetical protein GH733_002888 [Mirounga leonina]|nr:hypothetical protein GH733_002888 [Mirounga leonina]